MSKVIKKKLAELGLDDETSRGIIKLFHAEWKVRKNRLLQPSPVLKKPSTTFHEVILADSGNHAEYLSGQL